jgi:hypothetical protein
MIFDRIVLLLEKFCRNSWKIKVCTQAYAAVGVSAKYELTHITNRLIIHSILAELALPVSNLSPGTKLSPSQDVFGPSAHLDDSQQLQEIHSLRSRAPLHPALDSGKNFILSNRMV